MVISTKLGETQFIHYKDLWCLRLSIFYKRAKSDNLRICSVLVHFWSGNGRTSKQRKLQQRQSEQRRGCVRDRKWTP